MKTILFALMVGMIGLTLFFGSDGIIANFNLGTATSDTLITAGYPIAFATGILVLAIIKGLGRKPRDK